jgi:hypothetical protein
MRFMRNRFKAQFLEGLSKLLFAMAVAIAVARITHCATSKLSRMHLHEHVLLESCVDERIHCIVL